MANELTTTGTPNEFGGVHTRDKLERVRRYLVEYTTAMKAKGFRLAYIDAFAGSGSYRPTCPDAKSAGLGFFPVAAARELDGSARIALGVEPRFDKYIFIDKSSTNVAKLRMLREEYPNLGNCITIRRGDANACLETLCGKLDWTRWRAIVFLDPYGMQVDWATIRAIARTRAIDLLYLFPLGVAVNRMLPRDGHLSEAAVRRLDRTFGSRGWDSIYMTLKGRHLLGEYTRTVKVATASQIGEYFLKQLRTEFVGVARRPTRLHHGSKLLYWLCFATGDKDGAPMRVKKAEDILASPRARRGS